MYRAHLCGYWIVKLVGILFFLKAPFQELAWCKKRLTHPSTSHLKISLESEFLVVVLPTQRYMRAASLSIGIEIVETAILRFTPLAASLPSHSPMSPFRCFPYGVVRLLSPVLPLESFRQ